MVSQHQNLCIYSSKDPKKVPESTNKLGAQEALRPYLGAKEAKAHRERSAKSVSQLRASCTMYKEGRGRDAVVLLGSTAVDDNANKPNQERGSHSS